MSDFSQSLFYVDFMRAIITWIRLIIKISEKGQFNAIILSNYVRLGNHKEIVMYAVSLLFYAYELELLSKLQ